MIRTFFFFTIFWLGLLCSLSLLLIYYFLKILHLRKAEKLFIYFVTSRWARFTLFTAGIKLRVIGLNDVSPSHKRLVVISNHQGNFDIPVFIACLPFSAGFIAKKELLKLPFLSNWMKALECQPINRGNPRDSRMKLIERLHSNEKNPVFLFPEGTRSRGSAMGPFHTGTLKLIFHDQINVLPVTINGSYACYEKHNRIRAGRIVVTFHPIINTALYAENEFDTFDKDLQKIIAAPLER